MLAVKGPRLLVTYESLQGDLAAGMREVAEFLGEKKPGTAAGRSESTHTKTGTDSLRVEVENFDEVRAWLASSEGDACLLAQIDDEDGGVCHRCQLPAAWASLQCNNTELESFDDLSRTECSAGTGSYYERLLADGGGFKWGEADASVLASVAFGAS